jgi:hypothetical protein
LQLFIAGKKSSTHIHTAISENLFLQVEGRKHWVIYPPEYNPVFKVHIDRTPYFISDLVHDRPDPEKFPHFDKAVGYECTLQPGDILYNPNFFWHFVTSLEPSVSLGYRWIDPGAIWKQDPTLGFLTFCSFYPPLWKVSQLKDDFTKILTDKRNKRAAEKTKRDKNLKPQKGRTTSTFAGLHFTFFGSLGRSHFPFSLPDDLFALPSLDHASFIVQPDDGPGRTTLNRILVLVVFIIVDHRQVVDHLDQFPRGIHGTFATGGTADLAFFQDCRRPVRFCS